MRSLFARIWLSYVLVIALTLAMAAAIGYAVAVKRALDDSRISPAVLAQSAQATLAREGADGLNYWVMREAHENPELYLYFVDGSGRELMSRSIVGMSLPGAQGAVAPLVAAPNGVRYRLIVRRANGAVFGLERLIFQPYLLIALALATSLAGSAFLARHLTKPVVRLRAGVRAIAAGQLQTRMEPGLTRRSDELGWLARDFDRMAEDLSRQILAKEELLRDVSHELRSPLARLRVAASLARGRAADGDTETFDRIDREVERIDAMIGQILRFSRLESGPTPVREVVDLAEILEDTVADARLEAEGLGKSVHLSLLAAPLAVGDSAMVRSAIENVLRNAIRHAPCGSAVAVRLTRDARGARVTVLDDGPGVDDAQLQRIFEPFFRAGPSGGAGLGLTIAHRIVELHGGTISAANCPGHGLAVDIVLPERIPAPA